MEDRSLTRAQIKQLAKRMQDAFASLAALRCAPPETTSERHLQAARRMSGYGAALASLILEGSDPEIDLPGLRQDLHALMQHNCPALDIAELSIGCTSGAPATRDEILRPVGLTGRDLEELRTGAKWMAEWMAEIICRLRKPSLSGLSLLFPDILPKDVSREQFEQVEALPEVLRSLVKVLDNHPLRDLSSAEIDLLNPRTNRVCPWQPLVSEGISPAQTRVARDWAWTGEVRVRTVRRLRSGAKFCK
jgi:hypothetical protein